MATPEAVRRRPKKTKTPNYKLQTPNDKMEIQKDVFWKAFVLTLIVFILGIFVGYLLESGNIEKSKQSYSDLEIELANLELQSLYYQIMPRSAKFCEAAIAENLRFADKSYEFGLKISKYEEMNKLTQPLLSDKKKYVLSKLRFWFNNIQLKKNCNADFHNLVYFYSQFPDQDVKAKQEVQSAILENIKNKYGNKVMLIPLPLDLDLYAIDIIKAQYGISSAPILLIDEAVVLEGVQSEEKIEPYIII